MREWIMAAAMLALAGCSGGGGNAANNTSAEETPVFLQGGQWTLERKTTGYNTPSVTADEYAAKVGKSKSEDICLKVDDQGRPDANTLAGDEGKECTYKEAFVRNKRLVATLSCKAGSGAAEIVVEGNFTPDSMTFGTSMTRTGSDGAIDLRTTHDLTGKRTGDCS